jgi:hypothetical protein
MECAGMHDTAGSRAGQRKRIIKRCLNFFPLPSSFSLGIIRSLRMASVVRVGLLHSVIFVAIELEVLDSAVAVENAEVRILIMRIRSCTKVQLGGIAQIEGHVKFHAVAWSPPAPVSTVVFARADPERDGGRFHLRRVDPNPPTGFFCLSVRR